MALGAICFLRRLSNTVVSIQRYPAGLSMFRGGSVPTGELSYKRSGSVKFQHLESFQEEKLIFFPKQIYHLGN